MLEFEYLGCVPQPPQQVTAVPILKVLAVEPVRRYLFFNFDNNKTFAWSMRNMQRDTGI